MTTLVPSTTASLPVTPVSGTALQLSERGAALRATGCDLGNSGETVLALCALLSGILREVLSPDMIVLGIYQAEVLAKQAGVPKEEMDRVIQVVFENWLRNRSANPLSRMF